MEPFEIELKNVLTGTSQLPAAELAALNDRIVRSFARRQKGFYRLTLAYLAAMFIAILALLALFMCTSDLKECLLYSILILIFFEGTVLMKLWFWIMHGKIATAREIKLLQLAVAELKMRPPPDTRATAPAFPDGSTPAPPVPTARAPRKLWWIILLPVWLLAVAGLVCSEYLQNPFEPTDVTPYFEKRIAAGSGTGNTEWQQNFEVTRARQRFYAHVANSGKTAKIRISVAADGCEPMFTGPVEAGSRIGFGCATPGRYVVKGRTEQADGDFSLCIGGVDEVPGSPSFARFFLLLLSAAVVGIIPIVWLQDRWLQKIDPGLGK